MKTIKHLSIAIFVLSISFSITSFKLGEDEPELKWYTNMELAQVQAKLEHKTILMSFSGSDWCVNCMRLDKTLFQSKAFEIYAKANLILVKVDFPSKKKNKLSKPQQSLNDALADKYNKKGVFPLTLVLTADASLLGTMKIALNSADAYITHLKTIIK